MSDVAALSEGDAIAMLVAAEVVMACIAASCSSPQTAMINAKKRSGTLMQWVHIGCVEAGLLVGIAAMFTKRPGPILFGGAFAMGTMYAQYRYALKAGMKSNAPGTED